MKRMIMICMIVVWFFLLPAGASAVPQLEIEETVYSFQSVPEGEPVAHTFKLKNTGDTLLTILEVQPP